MNSEVRVLQITEGLNPVLRPVVNPKQNPQKPAEVCPTVRAVLSNGSIDRLLQHVLANIPERPLLVWIRKHAPECRADNGVEERGHPLRVAGCHPIQKDISQLP